MMVEGKRNLQLEINGINQVISSIYYVPSLKNNLLSVGQLQQKGLRVIIEDNQCEIWHKEQRRMVMHSTSNNIMFVILAKVKGDQEPAKIRCPQTTVKMEQLWHKRYGHLNHEGLFV